MNIEDYNKYSSWNTVNKGKIIPFSDLNLPTEFVMKHFKGAILVEGKLLLPREFDMVKIIECYKNYVKEPFQEFEISDCIIKKYNERVCQTTPTTPVDEINKVLEDRKKTHGDFRDHAYYTQSLKRVMRKSPNYDQMSVEQMEALDMIVHKIGRILAGNPDHKDHWLDIEGYAKLVSRGL